MLWECTGGWLRWRPMWRYGTSSLKSFFVVRTCLFFLGQLNAGNVFRILCFAFWYIYLRLRESVFACHCVLNQNKHSLYQTDSQTAHTSKLLHADTLIQWICCFQDLLAIQGFDPLKLNCSGGSWSYAELNSVAGHWSKEDALSKFKTETVTWCYL